MYTFSKRFYCDVAVVGGGTAGCAAAIESARHGMKTFLLEQGVTLGGLATNGYVPQVAGNIEGICLEFCQRLDAIGQLRMRAGKKDYYHNPSFEPEYGKIVLEDMVYEAGVRVIYDSTMIEPIVEDNKIQYLIFYSKGNYFQVIAKQYIDTTGDANVAALAGVPYEIGGQDFAGLGISTTQGSRWAGADFVKYSEAEAAYKKEQKEKGIDNPPAFVYVLEEEAIKRGELSRHVCNPASGFFRVIIPNTTDNNSDFVTFAFHSYYCRNLDVEDITRQVLEQHQLIKQWHSFMKNNVPGFENLRLVGLGSIPGVRDSRRIYGEYMLKSEDVACGNKFEDGIARFPEFFDSHHPTSDTHVFMRHIHIKEPAGSAVCEEEHVGVNCDAQMHPFGIPAGIPARPNPKDYCEIPYRSLVPEKIDNLLCAGRCSSAEFHANGAVRIIGPAMGTGMAAGLAASMSVERKVCPRDIDGKELRQLLISEGVELDKPCDGHWKELREMDCTFEVNWGDKIFCRPVGKEGEAFSGKGDYSYNRG